MTDEFAFGVVLAQSDMPIRHNDDGVAAVSHAMAQGQIPPQTPIAGGGKSVTEQLFLQTALGSI